MTTITKLLNEWIEAYGSPRDALNVAIARFLYYKELYEELLSRTSFEDVPAICDCGAELQIVRPGKYQCPNCG